MLDQERGKSDSTQGYIRVRDTTNEADIFSLLGTAHYLLYRGEIEEKLGGL